MKRCPYCAEEIQEEAVICRWCHMKVKGIWLRRIARVAIAGAIVICVAVFVMALSRFAGEVSEEMGLRFESLKGTFEDIRKGFSMIEEYGDQLDAAGKKQR